MHSDQGIFGLPSVNRGYLIYPLPAPVRLLDTRAGQPACVTPAAQITAGTFVTHQLKTLCTGIPSEARGFFGNLIVVNESAGGYLTLWPTGVAQPGNSNVNYFASTTLNAFCFSAVNESGFFNIYSSATVDLIIDVTAYIA